MKDKKINKTPSTDYVRNERNNSIEIVNKYGTYEIQPTADTNNQYPAIAQGFNKKIIKNDCQNLEKEKNQKKPNLTNDKGS